MIDEGVIKFFSEHRSVRLGEDHLARAVTPLLRWRRVLLDQGLVGQDPARYGGAGFGNLSVRVSPVESTRGERCFLITGSQTGGIDVLTLGDFALVERYRLDENRLWSRGERSASSESLTHGALYDLDTQLRVVMHVHAPILWQMAGALGVPQTNPTVPYGTPAMAAEMARLYRGHAVGSSGLWVMGGHEDGVIAFGINADEVGRLILNTLALAKARLAEPSTL